MSNQLVFWLTTKTKINLYLVNVIQTYVSTISMNEELILNFEVLPNGKLIYWV